MTANAVALVATAVANTAANRRFTFGVQGRAGLTGDHIGGANATATLARFALLRTVILERRRPYAPIIEIPRRHS